MESGMGCKDGKKVEIKDPNDANDLGIGMVHQHFKLVEIFTVLENIMLAPVAVRKRDKTETEKLARELLAKRGISCKGKTARKMSRADYDRFDLILVMDNSNMRNIMRIVGSDPKGKIKMLMEYAGKPHAEVADPWYSGDFEETWRDVSAACGGLLASL